ncbi:uncharacterized protein [Asterias amurensis]|uniref:uncharacterized protein n=1 Tax=Asterias amurensis TaxID=7602 RepID=UPI003AB1AECF
MIILIQLLIKQLQGIRFNTMDGRMSMYVLLVCVWCSLDAGGLLMAVTAETPDVSPVILTAEADRKEGGRVDMRCTATNLQSKHIVSWSATNPDRILRLGDVTVTTESRFMFSTQTDRITGRTVQDFTIINVQREDSNRYVCKVNDPTPDGAYNLVTSSSVTLLVLYFPNASFPICSPAGPITVNEGTVLSMSCASESGHRAVIAAVTHSFYTSRYTPWTAHVLDDTDTLIRTSSLTADVADNCIAFKCTIKLVNFPDIERSCTIGPITVVVPMCTSDPTTSTSWSSQSDQFINHTNQDETEFPITDTQTFLPTTDSLSPSTPWILAFVFVLVIAIALFLLLIVCIIRKNRLIKSLNAEKETKVTKADPYMELQPTEDKNKVYMEPTTSTTTTQDTYYQPVEVETDSPEYDYARPEGSTNTSYEVVKQPQSSAERPYQNINNKTKQLYL